MNIVDKIMSRFGYTKKGWEQIWLRAAESILTREKVTEPFKQHPAVYKAIKAISDNIPQAEFKFIQGEKEVEPPKLVHLFNWVNPLMSRSQLWEATVIFLSSKGECFWILSESIGQKAETRDSVPSEIWVFNPEKFKPVKEQDLLTGWTYNNKKFGLNEIIHFKYFNPYDPLRGLSPYDAIKMTVDLDYKSLLYNSKFFENFAEAGIVLETEKSLSDTQYNRLVKQWETRHQGISKAGKLALLEGGLKYKGTGKTHKEMEFMDQRRYNREEILGIWRVPKAMFSITDDLNYATFIGQKKVFWTDTIIPILRMIEEKLNSDFFPKFAPTITGKFDLSNVIALQEDFHKKVETAHKLFQIGFTGNEINEKLELGFDEKPWREQWWIPFNLLPAGTSAPPAEEGKALKKQLEDKSLQIWRNFVGRLEPIEIKFASSLKRYFFEQRQEALSGIKKNHKARVKFDIGLTINWDEQDDRLIKLAIPYLADSIGKGIEIGKEFIGDIDFDLFNPKILSFLSEKKIKIKAINATIREQLRIAIGAGLEAGETIAEISDRIRRVYNMASTRARIIARTEAAGAMNGGLVLTYKEAGVGKHEWVTSGDEFVRLSHASINGEIVSVNKRFSNGVDIPGGDGPAGEIINCRCTTVPVIERGG